MDNLPRKRLAEIVARHGRGVANNYRRCEGLLRDYCSGYRREVAVLVAAMEERVAVDLLAAENKLPPEVVLSKLARRLHDNLAMEENAARWAVNSWALALGFISSAEFESIERVEHQTVAPKATAVPAKAKPQAMASTASADIVLSAKGDGDYKSFREAMQNVPANSRLLVRPGLYREGFIIDKPMEIIGDGKREEIIIASANASCVLMQTTEATVRGLTLRQEEPGNNNEAGFFAVEIPQGRLILEECDITSKSLACIGIHNDMTEPLIRRCRIHAGADSGIYIFNNAKGTIEECDIYDCRNVIVAITEGAAPIIRRCSIRDGRDAGIVVWNRGAGLIEDCNIFGNAKTNVGISEEGKPMFRHCRIYDGKNSGVFVHNGGQATLEDCDTYHHVAAEVAVTRRGNLTMSQCRIHDGQDAGLFISNAGRLLIRECEVFANADAGVNVDPGGVAAIYRCRINRNSSFAIRVKAGGAIQVEESDLTHNGIAPWQNEYGARVQSLRNKM